MHAIHARRCRALCHIVAGAGHYGAGGGDTDDDDDILDLTVPISVSDGLSTAQFYGDFQGKFTANTAEPIEWPAEPPAEEETLEVSIDIKPGETPNCFNINDHGVIPVAILGSVDFDTAQVDASTLDFNGLAVRVRGNGQPSYSIDDVNGDGFPDLACRFEDNADSWLAGASEALVTGNLFDGTAFQGVDSICLVPPAE